MVFKNFYFNIIFRILLLTIATGVLTFCIIQQLYLRAFYSGIAVIIILSDLIWYVNRFNRDIRAFLISLLQRDFTTHFNAKGRSKSFSELYESLNKITELFKTISSEKEIQYRYLEMLVDHIQVGIISYDENEKVYLVNNALKRLLQRDTLVHLKSLDAIDSNLLHVIRTIASGETRLIKVHIDNNILQLSLHASEFKLDAKYYKLVSMQNIRNELDAREMDAWQKLIRVLTHEIMNSVSPITSLSDTLHKMITTKRERDEALDDPSLQSLAKGLEAIKIRSEGLQNFTQAYRSLTKIPVPQFAMIKVSEILQPIQTLLRNELEQKNIHFTISIQENDLVIMADKELIGQVIINLIRNSIDALQSVSHPQIYISAYSREQEIVISIKDNGEGILPDQLDKIFIPFFTTKKSGSGIGLALSRQILQLHNAVIQVKSIPGEETVFLILF